jgi:DNA-binding NarL/FixJ family response regulator
LDLNMPGTPTLAAIPSFLEAVPGAAVVVMTMHKDLAFAREALGAGASGYVLKEAARTELVDAVHAAAVGNTYLDPPASARAWPHPPRPRRPPPSQISPSARRSPATTSMPWPAAGAWRWSTAPPTCDSTARSRSS